MNRNVEDIISVVGVFILGLVAVLIGAVLAGIIVWLLWPIVVPAFFPGLVASGVIAGAVGLWESIAFTWLFATIVNTTKSSVTAKKS
jgi:hypothetical protein